MVDLVKIRKKAKEKKAEAAAQADSPAASPAGAASLAHGGAGEDTGAPPGTGAPPDAGASVATVAPVASVDRIVRFLETAGERRVSKSRVADESPTSFIELLTFVMGGESYAIDIANVVEIITTRPITRVPNADPTVVGIISLRGMIVTMIDARGRLGHAAIAQPSLDARVVVIDRGGENAGFLVDRVLRVVKVAEGTFEPHPVVHSSEHDESVRGVFRQGDALTILLDLDNLLGAATAAIS